MQKIEVDHQDFPVAGTGVVFRCYLSQDLGSSDVKTAFALFVDARWEGIQFGHVEIDPLANQSVTLPCIWGGSIDGRVDDFQGFQADGTPCPADDWSAASEIRFQLSAIGVITSPFKIPVLGAPSIKVTLGHVQYVYAIPRTAAGNVTHPQFADAARFLAFA